MDNTEHIIQELKSEKWEMAQEIERLREALNDCLYYLAMDGAIEGSLRVIEIATAALKQKETE